MAEHPSARKQEVCACGEGVWGRLPQVSTKVWGMVKKLNAIQFYAAGVAALGVDCDAWACWLDYVAEVGMLVGVLVENKPAAYFLRWKRLVNT